MNDLENAMSIYTSAIMSAILTTYWLYKGDANTQIEDVDKEKLLIELMSDQEFMGMVLDTIRTVGLT